MYIISIFTESDVKMFLIVCEFQRPSYKGSYETRIMSDGNLKLIEAREVKRLDVNRQL